MDGPLMFVITKFDCKKTDQTSIDDVIVESRRQYYKVNFVLENSNLALNSSSQLGFIRLFVWQLLMMSISSMFFARVFVRKCFMKLFSSYILATKITFVWKMRAKNVDEIDSWLHLCVPEFKRITSKINSSF